MKFKDFKQTGQYLKFLYWFTFIVLICALFVILILWRWWHKPVDITADFGDRSSAIAIPPNFFGTSGLGSTIASQSGIDNVTNVHMTGNRIWAYMDRVYPNGDTPDYSQLDGQLSRGSQNGLQLQMTLYGTPRSLAPQNCAMPSDYDKWSQLAAQLVAHVNAKYPGLEWELWNEPDISGMCNSTNQLQDYLKLYSTFGPYFRKAAPTAKLGGPALASSGNTVQWMGAFLSGATAPYVDFATFHIYITGTWLLPGMTWDQAYTQTQAEPGGLAYYYRLFEQQVRAGQQPNAAHTPIGITEYNTNYAFQPNNVQNVPVYGPLWNTVAVADFLNVVVQGVVPPSFIDYFTAGFSTGYFCLEGVQGGDPKMCSPPSQGQPFNATYVPYPTLKPYELFCSTHYLDLEQGFNVVKPPAAPNGLLTLALYTQAADILLIINPTATDASGLNVGMSNLGFRAVRGESYTLKDDFTTNTLKVRGNKMVKTQIDVPAYSTVAIRLAPQ